jgi:transketolase C-terminal domain/subunit
VSASDLPEDWRTRAANQTRLAFGQALLDLARLEPRTVVVSADTQDLLGIRPYIERHPERFVELGIAEQNAIGVAAGLATTGMRPYVCAYAPFITARSMEQLRNDVAYARQRVVIGAAASGVSLGVAGGTHHALEDLALLRSSVAKLAQDRARLERQLVHADGDLRLTRGEVRDAEQHEGGDSDDGGAIHETSLPLPARAG